jgi:hypothetical protein
MYINLHGWYASGSANAWFAGASTNYATQYFNPTTGVVSANGVVFYPSPTYSSPTSLRDWLLVGAALEVLPIEATNNDNGFYNVCLYK